MNWKKNISMIIIILAVSLSHGSRMEQLSKLMPLDEISVSVFENPDFETNTMITEIGEISMPLIGKIKISGLTLEEAENVIEAKYSDGFIKSPCVLIRVVKRAQEQVTVLGNVQNQRVIEFDSNRGLTLTEALGKANGPTLKADISKIILTSIDANGQPQSKQIDMKVIIQGKTKDIQLQNGDLIYVKESMF